MNRNGEIERKRKTADFDDSRHESESDPQQVLKNESGRESKTRQEERRNSVKTSPLKTGKLTAKNLISAEKTQSSTQSDSRKHI